MKATHGERQHALLPKHIPTQRVNPSMTTLKFVTSWWGEFVMLSKMETCF